jgi:hypothetical protein
VRLPVPFRNAPIPAVAVDALLYAGSTGFALWMFGSGYVRHRTWGAFAVPAYTFGAAASIVLAFCALRLARRWLEAVRVLVATLVLAGAVLVPLSAEVRWRAQRGPDYAASEVAITEQAGAALAQWRDPYSARLDSVELAQRPKSVGHFPYLPGMAVFGLPRALIPHALWTDARVFFAIATALAAAAALCCWSAPRGVHVRAMQILVVLPTGAAAIVGGGDDVPVLALSLLALVLFQRQRHTSASVAVAVAGLLKLTAWPLMFALAIAGRASGRRMLSPLTLAPVVVFLGVLAAAQASPADFADDVIMFPQGLSSLPSPAASITLGSLAGGVVSARGIVTWLCLGVALLVSAAVFRRLAREPAPRASTTAASAAAILLTLVILAPVARSGYFVYPIELLVWGALLGDRAPPMRPRQASELASLERGLSR